MDNSKREKRVLRASELLREGHTLNEIGAALGVSASTVCRDLQSVGGPARSAPRAAQAASESPTDQAEPGAAPVKLDTVDDVIAELQKCYRLIAAGPVTRSLTARVAALKLLAPLLGEAARRRCETHWDDGEVQQTAKIVHAAWSRLIRQAIHEIQARHGVDARPIFDRLFAVLKADLGALDEITTSGEGDIHGNGHNGHH